MGTVGKTAKLAFCQILVLVLFTNFSLAQGGPGTLQCGGSRVVTESSGRWLHLPFGQSKLTHFQTAAGEVPRLVYWKKIPNTANIPYDNCHRVTIREGAVGQSFGTSSDWVGTIPTSVFAPYSCPNIVSVAAYGQYLAFSVKDGRQISQGQTLEGNRIFLLELASGGQILTNQVVEYAPLASPITPIFKDLRFDHEPSPSGSNGPILSWLKDSLRPFMGAASDDVFWCYARACSGGVPTHIWNPQWWVNMNNGWVSERGASSPPIPETIVGAFGIKFHLQPGLYDGGIYQTGPQGVATWLDEVAGVSPNLVRTNEIPWDHFGPFMFYQGPDANFEKRLHITGYDTPPASSGQAWYIHSAARPGSDENLILSQYDGLTYAGSGMGGNSDRFFMFEEHESLPQNGGTLPPGYPSFKFEPSEVRVATAGDFGNDQPLSAFFTIPAEHWTYAQGVSKNLFIVSVLPNPWVFDLRYLSTFLDSQEDLLTYAFYCVH